MPGTYQYDVEIKSNVAKLLSDMKQVQDRLDTVEGREYTIKLNIDEKKLSNVISNLEKMLDSLGKGTGDFKQFENLSKELSSIVSEVQSLSKAFGKVDDTGAKTLLSSIQNIDKSLSELSQNILNINKNMSNMGGNTSGAVKQVENITNESKKAASALEDVAKAQEKVNGQKTNISSGSDSAIEQQIKQQDKLQDEIRETIALTNEYGEVIDVYRGTHGLIGNGNVSNRYHGGTFWTSNRKLATQSYADGNKVTHANLYMRNPYLVHGGGADWDQLTLSIKQGEELEKHLENVYASINDVFSKIQDTSGIEAGHLFDVFDGQLNFTDFENGIQKPIESLKDFQNIFESIDYDNSKIPQVQNYINQLYDLFTSYSRISQLSEKGVLNTNEVVEIAKALKYDGVVFNGIRDGSDDSSDIFVTFEEKQSKVIDMITAAQLRVEEEQQLANILVNTRENLYKTLKSLDSKQVDEFIDKSAFNFVTDGSYMENLGEVLGKADPTDSIDNIKNKIREYINEVVNEFENAQKQIADSTEPTKDAFPNADTKLDEVVTSAKDLDKTLEQVDIPTDSFDKVLEKLDRTKSELVDIVKITKQSVSDAEGKFHDSYTLKDSRGSTEIYGVNSKTDKGQILRQNIVGYDKKKDELDISKAQLEVDKKLAKEEDNLAKAQQKKVQVFLKEQANYEEDQKKAELIKRQTFAYEELTDTISKYSEVAKRVADGNAEDGDLELMTKLEDKISQLQKQPILSDSQVLKSEKSLVSLYDQLDKIERKLVETNQKSQDKQITGFDKRLESYTKKTSGYDATIARFNDGGWTSDTYLEKVQAIKNAVKEYETLLNNIKTNQNGIATDEDIQNLDKYEKKIKDTIATVTNMSASEKGYNFVSGQKELDKIHKLLNENSKMSSEAKAKIQAYYREIESGNPSMSLDKIHGEILKIYNAEVEAGRAGRTLWDTLKNSGFHQIAAQMAGMVGIYDVINMVRQGVNTVRELDTAMTEVRKVSNATEGQYDSFKDTISSTAKEIATTNKELLNSSADFLRLGYSLDQANDLAKNATLFVNVGDGVDITEATEDMITAMKAFDIKAEDSIKIVDDYNQIGNRFALSASDIGEAMKRSASALETGNNSFEQSIGLITAMNEIVQNSENTGNSLKVLSLRLRGAKAELEDMQEDTDGLCDSTSKLREQIKSLTGVDIMLDDNTFKSTTDIIKELGAVWDKLSDSSQAATLELIAGKSRANNVAALLKNYQKIDEVMKSLGDAEGSAMRENEAIVDSINGRIKVLSATAEEFWQNFIDTDLVKELVSLTSDLLNILTKIVNIGNGAGTLGLIGAGTGIFKFIKNFDWVFKPYIKLSNSF